MDWSSFTPVAALAGGALIGVAVSVLLLMAGRVAGIAGIVAGVMRPVAGDVGWRRAFVVGLVVVGAVVAVVSPLQLAPAVSRSGPAMLVAGLVVGYGTRLGNGCTSGHGICGLSRLSGRSLVATIAFIASGIITVTFVRVVAGGVL